MVEACIVADDLTGAADTGVSFVGVGATYVFLPWTDLDQAFSRHPGAAYAVDTATRSAPKSTAYNRTYRALKACDALNPRILYLKLDSALRGHVGVALSSLQACRPDRPIPVVCAFPETGRTTVNGIQLVNGTPVDAHEMGKDVLTPVGAARISLLLAEYGASLEVSLSEVRSGGLSDRLDQAQRSKADFVVIDAETRDDLDRIASALIRWNPKVACAGSGGLAGSLAKAISTPKPHDVNAAFFAGAIKRGPALTVTTSLKSVTAMQLDALVEAFPETLCLALSPSLLSERMSAKGDVNRLADAACGALQSGRDVIVHAPFDQPPLPGAGAHLLEAVGTIVSQAHERATIALTITVGGDTAAAILRHTGAAGIRLIGEMAPGVALGEIAGGQCHGAALVTKSGGFGSRETLVQVRRSVGV